MVKDLEYTVLSLGYKVLELGFSFFLGIGRDLWIDSGATCGSDFRDVQRLLGRSRVQMSDFNKGDLVLPIAL